MDNDEKKINHLKEILNEHPKGLTITEIAKLLKLNRISTSKYLNILLALGQAEMRIHGPSKVFYPSQRVPISSILNFSSSLFLVMNDNLSIMSVNDALLNCFSIRKEDLIGHRLDYSPIGSYITQNLIDSIQRSSNFLETTFEEKWEVFGEEKYFKIKIIPITFEDKSLGVALIIDDITELTRSRLSLEQLVEDRSKELSITNKKLTYEIVNHKKTLSKLKISEKKYRELIENSNCLIIKLDLMGNVIYFNEFAQFFFGYSIAEVIGNEFFNVFQSKKQTNEKNWKDFVQNLSNNLEKNQNHREIIKKDGTRCWVAWTKKNILDSHGKNSEILLIGHDITYQKIVEEKLVAIIDFLPDATFVIDIKGRVIAWNRAIEEMTGVKADNIIGLGNYEYSMALYGDRTPIFIDFALDPDSDISERYINYKKEGNTIIGESYNTFLDPDGIYLWGKASPIYDTNGCIVGAIESFRDITHLKN